MSSKVVRTKRAAAACDPNQARLPLGGLTLYDIISMLPALERAAVSNWTLSGLSKRKSARKKMGSQAPYGFRHDGTQVVRDEGEQRAIDEMLVLASSGLSLSEIGRALERKGIVNRNGRRLSHSTIGGVLKKSRGARSAAKTSGSFGTMIESVRADVVKVSLADFENFLRAQDPESWDVDHLEFESQLSGKPVTVDELMGAIIMHGNDDDYVYVFSDEHAPYAIANRTDWDRVPTVGSRTLDDYIVRAVRGADFLYFACSEAQAANGDYITLFPRHEQGEDEQQQ